MTTQYRVFVVLSSSDRAWSLLISQTPFVALSADEISAIVADWEKLTGDSGFQLSIEVRCEPVTAELEKGDGQISARLAARLYCQVQGRRDGALLFDEQVPYEAEMVRSCVAVLASAIAARAPSS